MSAKRKQKNENPASGPLVSWDFFMENYHRRMKLGDDLLRLRLLSGKNKWEISWDLQQKLITERKVILITTLTHHIVFASSNMEEMTGYTPEEVIGKKPSLFQGKETSLAIKAEINACVKNGEPFHVTLVNYKKNGQPYDCEIDAYPLLDKRGQTVNFIAFESIVD